MLKAGLAKAFITPQLGANLVGYFDPRPAEGVLDDLYLRVMLLEYNGSFTGFLAYDLCYVTAEQTALMRKRMSEAGIPFADKLCISAIHTHTGPGTETCFSAMGTPGYDEFLAEETVRAVKKAWASMAPAELFHASEKKNDYAFVRRYWMKSGRVITNPGKLNPDTVRPESELDPTVSVLALHQAGRIAALMVNLTNHTDTVSGNLISADWPGRMEQEIQYQLTESIPVFTLVDAQGDVNHFDVNDPANQTSYAEAIRIGRGYGQQVVKLLEHLQPVPVTEISVDLRMTDFAYRDISDEEAAEAQSLIDRIPADLKSDKPMTSEDLVSGEGPAARYFAGNVLRYKELCSGKSRPMELMTIQLGKNFAFACAPAECFNGISREVRQNSPFANTWFVTLANGRCGYVAMPECFSRGGYETLPWVGGGPHEKTARQIIDTLGEMLDKGK